MHYQFTQLAQESACDSEQPVTVPSQQNAHNSGCNDATLTEVDVPADEIGGWRVEAEFIGAIRGEEPIQFTDFATGVRYMAFIEAVHQSAATARPVHVELSP